MTTINHQQAAVRAGAEAIMRAGGLERFLGTSGLYNLPVWLRAKRDSENALAAATPHLRAGIAEEVRYRRSQFHDAAKTAFGRIGSSTEAYLNALDDVLALLEGGGACCEHSKCPGGSICCCQEGGAE